MFDLVKDPTSIALTKEFAETDKIVSAVCHGPAALLNVKLSDGSYLIQSATGVGEAIYQSIFGKPFPK